MTTPIYERARASLIDFTVSASASIRHCKQVRPRVLRVMFSHSRIIRNSGLYACEQTLLQGKILSIIVFLPILGRSFFPQIRDANSITFQSSFFDPQILGVYLLWAYCLYCFLRRPDKLRWLLAPPLWPLTVFTVIAVISAIMVSRSHMYSLWRCVVTGGVLLWGALALAESRDGEPPFRLFVSFYAISALMLLGVVAAMVVDPQARMDE